MRIAAYTLRTVAEGSTEDYQWGAFHKAILGEHLEGEWTTEETVLGLHVIRAMCIAAKSGKTEAVSSPVLSHTAA